MLQHTVLSAGARNIQALLVVALLVCGSLCSAQSSTSARLTGSVSDASGAVVGKVQVTARNTYTNLSTVVTSDSAGNYAFNSLPVGHYQITAIATGFETLVDSGIQLTVGQSATLNLPLRAGGSSDTVSVSGDADLIITTTAELSQVVGESTIKDLPLNGRDPGTLVFLSAGVTNALNSNASTLQTASRQHVVPAGRCLSYGHLSAIGAALP